VVVGGGYGGGEWGGWEVEGGGVVQERGQAAARLLVHANGQHPHTHIHLHSAAGVRRSGWQL